MSVNLSLLAANEKQLIELDKQASFLVWKLKQAKVGPEEIIAQSAKLKSDEERACFEQSIEKYKRVMGVM
ncbi:MULTISPECIES: DUF3283 family protein [unclassified Vibrio]|uniref:DUF3283 family protein n=1 Tax=unclassified Vibrio TaxID=2614977 RepID=UPI0014938EFC|nr:MULTISPECIES: DUF3283 family protein [unclassified Vibrio]NOI66807.1 DUF3283 family protein [Vibrio sp. 99-8-1]